MSFVALRKSQVEVIKGIAKIILFLLKKCWVQCTALGLLVIFVYGVYGGLLAVVSGVVGAGVVVYKVRSTQRRRLQSSHSRSRFRSATGFSIIRKVGRIIESSKVHIILRNALPLQIRRIRGSTCHLRRYCDCRTSPRSSRPLTASPSTWCSSSKIRPKSSRQHRRSSICMATPATLAIACRTSASFTTIWAATCCSSNTEATGSAKVCDVPLILHLSTRVIHVEWRNYVQR